MEEKAMIGSEKQVAWAEQIKADAIATCDANISSMTDRAEQMREVAQKNGRELAKTPFDAQIAAIREIRGELVKLFEIADDAKFYIDNRDHLSGRAVLDAADKIALYKGRADDSYIAWLRKKLAQ